ncbi:MAG: CoA transferase [Deltaproteobacteria bacterium]|nr:CoA transferase [Deltaproteobacteria bacterium]
MNGGPLQGVRILELSYFLAGPAATSLMAQLGAEVIKVESIQRPDPWRMFQSLPVAPPDIRYGSSAYDLANTDKLCVGINISKPKGAEVARRLAAKVDIVSENFTPGVVDRLGLGYEDIRKVKPDIIYVSSSSCGNTGPLRDYVGYAPIFASMSGASHCTGYEDGPPSFFLGGVDQWSAYVATFGMMAALIHHQSTGEGQFIQHASVEAIALYFGDQYLDYILNNRIANRKGNRHGSCAPHNCYRCAGEDKWVTIAVMNEREWLSLCRVMEKPELANDSRFSTSTDRWTNQKELDAIITEWTKDKDYYEATEILQGAGVAAAPSLDPEGLFKDPHVKQRGMFVQIDHPATVGINEKKDWVFAPPWRLSETPGSVKRHAPILCEHTDRIFEEIVGMPKKEIQSLREEGILS